MMVRPWICSRCETEVEHGSFVEIDGDIYCAECVVSAFDVLVRPEKRDMGEWVENAVRNIVENETEAPIGDIALEHVIRVVSDDVKTRVYAELLDGDALVLLSGYMKGSTHGTRMETARLAMNLAISATSLSRE